VLAATTAFGKTVLAASMIAERGRNTLVLVHRKQLLEQWVAKLSEFLNIGEEKIGRIGGGRKKPSGFIDVATIQSLVRKGVVNDCVAEYGHLIVDECHHLSARSFELVASSAKPRYVLGLSATVTRKDGHHPIIFMQCGPLRHRVDAKAAAAERPFEHTVFVRPTDFQPVEPPEADQRRYFQKLYRELLSSDRRNDMICRDVIKNVREGRSPLVLTERREHIDRLYTRLKTEVQHTIVLKGNTGARETKEQADLLEAIPPNESRVVIATGKYVGEGFDDPRLDTLFLTLPISWRGTLAQYAGRLHRQYVTKMEVKVYDYADFNVPMLARMFDKRCAGYESIGYRIALPGSAVSGWPSEVELPVDPKWKSDYAGTIRRLIQDGVDTELADLFVHVARNFEQDSTGEERARSASEAFLYNRLQSLTTTADRFQLNVQLPIPFDGWGNMEVDLLDAKSRLVIELDGGHHFADKDAYRRDRRKDSLLQQHGYFVLRFLVEDIGKRLDEVLDTITRAIVYLSKD
jgi:superfamily II DNA or RNA helicase/very-short-patch-repair endonuclease